MKFSIQSNHLVKSLQQVFGVFGSRPSLPILGHLLIKVVDNILWIITTNLEVELISRVILLDNDIREGSVTIPARKFLDICRSFSSTAMITLTLEKKQVKVYSGRGVFFLSTSPPNNFPNINALKANVVVSLAQSELRNLVKKTHFSMANQDIRYYLNGMLFEIEGSILRTIATDGHRMAISKTQLISSFPSTKIILPRKSVQELLKLLDISMDPVLLKISDSILRIEVENFILTSKLVDGCFPDYRLVFPENINKVLQASCDDLYQAFSRVGVLSNEKIRSVRINLSNDEMRITTSNVEQEKAEEIIDVSYSGEDLEIAFNVKYILDVLSTLRCKKVRLSMSDSNSSILIENAENSNAMYVVMPIRL
ncbi:DNA polymerase III subunit beta [Candidatus Photodesmus katoptron]|uniref:Beta sliding clamp n=1 Tax=Candidatus Photodesmus katoptron Akat1 TaxID=1236703 RepID=S3E018_9GAMM|nr:DNA polymerase III subunit beta [Candidatus Photodesmus katoptron]EPE37561.1 DNA polymerase III, beta subunit [Candidatus Photodesmus katoptron Akat1]KEY90728.1 DNA polymerase III subunit beta [Candidatus Photodesmus katoptron]